MVVSRAEIAIHGLHIVPDENKGVEACLRIRCGRTPKVGEPWGAWESIDGKKIP